MPSVPVLLIVVVAIIIALILIAILAARNYRQVPPNVAAVFTGRGKPKVITGGSRFQVPIFERYDEMSLEPFSLTVEVPNAISIDGVGISVTGRALVRFGSSEEALATSTQRFLTIDRHELHTQLQEMVAGQLRAICATMTVEELNSKRDEFKTKVLDGIGSDLNGIGMELDVLTVQDITDKNGYMDALGRKRLAEVRGAATIGEAEAERDSKIRSAEARQQGAVAEAKAETQIATANQARDIELARIRSDVDAANARAEQAGPLAAAEGRKAVVLAEANVESQQQQAMIEVERQRAARVVQAQQADTIAPAEAARQASILRAQGDREAAILKAQAEAETRTLSGQADATAREVLAAASQTEATARAAGREAELIAEANGKKAGMLAEANGQQALAEALNALSPEAARQRVLPDMIKALPEMAAAIAGPMAQIDRIVLIDGNGNGGENGEGGDTLSRLAGMVPIVLAQAIETLRATTGTDLSSAISGSLGGNGELVQAASTDSPAAAATE